MRLVALIVVQLCPEKEIGNLQFCSECLITQQIDLSVDNDASLPYNNLLRNFFVSGKITNDNADLIC